MSHQFKPGDLAIIVKTFTECSENIGRCVEVIEVDDPPIDDHPIHVLAVGLLVKDPFLDEFVSADDCWSRPSALMPLRGDFAPEQQKSQEVSA